MRNDATARYDWYGVMVFSCVRAGIQTITGFADAAIRPRFGLPPHLEP